MKKMKDVIILILGMGIISGLIYALPAAIAGVVTFSPDVYIGAVTNPTYAVIMTVVTLISIVGVACWMEEDNG